MRELRAILDAYDELVRRRARAVLATVVRVAGSTYRRPGARMLIPEAGRPVGLISGGCLEPDVALRSREVLASGVPALLRYDTRSDDDLIWGLGLGCNGLIELLLERVPVEAEPDPLAVLAESARGDRRSALATVFAAPEAAPVAVGDRLALRESGERLGGLADAELETRVTDDAREALERGIIGERAYETPAGRVELLIEGLEPPIPLLVIGGGPDALPVTRLAAELGFEVTLVDPRPEYANPDHFPDARRVLECEPRNLLDRVPIGSRSVALVMTHVYRHDLEALRVLLPSGARYVGVLGPRQRTERLLKDLAAAGSPPSAAQRARLYGPVGLDIGADTPEEIALSVLAEVRAALAGAPGGSLRDRKGPIHPPKR